MLFTFIIKDSADNIIPFEILNAEVAEFWGKEIKSDEYISPDVEYPTTTYVQGIQLAREQVRWRTEVKPSWKSAIDTACAKYAPGHIDLDWLGRSIECPSWTNVWDYQDFAKYTAFQKPYVELLKYWEDKGYKCYIICS